MRVLTLLLTPLLAAGVSLAADDYDALSREYTLALKAHKDKLAQARDVAERRELRSNPPAADFWARFQALSTTGDGRALFWMARNVDESGLNAGEVRDERKRLYTELVRDHVTAPWFAEVLAQIPRERKYLGSDEIERIGRLAGEKGATKHVRAFGLHVLRRELILSEDEAKKKEADAIFERLADEFADTEVGAEAAAQLFESRYLEVGKIAPDFTGKTIDGHEFKLSDYRGKVVLVDFYGFW